MHVSKLCLENQEIDSAYREVVAGMPLLSDEVRMAVLNSMFVAAVNFLCSAG